MKPAEFEAKWREEAELLRRRRAQVDAGELLEEVLTDFRAVVIQENEELLDLQAASRESGYSADHLGRLVRDGVIRNAGRRNAPKIRRGDLPRKAGALRESARRLTLGRATPGQIARAVVTSERKGETR